MTDESAVAPADAVRGALDAFDRAFAAGHADALAELFTDDGQMLLLYREPLQGRAAIRDHSARAFAEYDPGAWRTQPLVVDVHDDRAYVLSVYTETMVHRGGGPSLDIRGRLVLFLRREPDGAWRFSIALNQHSRRTEEVPR